MAYVQYYDPNKNYQSSKTTNIYKALSSPSTPTKTPSALSSVVTAVKQAAQNASSKSSNTSTSGNSNSGYIPPGAVWNRYGEIIGTDPSGKGYTNYSDEATNIHGGWNGSYQGTQGTSTNIGGRNVNLLNNISSSVIGGNIPGRIPELGIQYQNPYEDYLRKQEEYLRQQTASRVESESISLSKCTGLIK